MQRSSLPPAAFESTRALTGYCQRIGNPTYQWRRFPFALAGPLSLALYACTSLGGVLTLLFAPAGDQAWIGLAVFAVLWCSLEIARRVFASRRKLKPPSIWMPPGRSSQLLVVGSALFSVIAPRALGWQDGAIWVLYGIASYAQETYRHLRWRARGYPGTEASGWALDD